MQANPPDKDNPSDKDWDKPMFDDAVLMTHKAAYVKKEKHYVKQTKETCVICGIINQAESVESYELYRNDNIIVFLNLYPYTVGHILISPIRHLQGYDDLSKTELIEMAEMSQRVIKMLKHFGRTESMNVGWNQGPFSGGSINHFHIHYVPRWKNELNFFEIIARTRPMIQSLDQTLDLLKKYVPYLEGNKEIDEIFEN